VADPGLDYFFFWRGGGKSTKNTKIG